MKSIHISQPTCWLKFPVISLITTAASLIIYLCSGAATFLQYDRALIAGGEYWRIFTGHWTHWSFDHFLWCSLTFLVLGSIGEKLSRKGFVITILASAVIIPAVNWQAAPTMLYYRGLSGICSGVFITASILLIRNAIANKDLINTILPAAGCVFFIAKIIYEFISGQAIFVHSDATFTPMPLAHLTGGAVGLITSMLLISGTQRQAAGQEPLGTCINL